VRENFIRASFRNVYNVWYIYVERIETNLERQWLGLDPSAAKLMEPFAPRSSLQK